MHPTSVPGFDWEHYLNLAYELAGTSPPSVPDAEAKSRAAISRAYYAAFCHARNYLKTKRKCSNVYAEKDGITWDCVAMLGESLRGLVVGCDPHSGTFDTVGKPKNG